MYFFFKIIFLLYLYLPQYNGSILVYERVFKDLFNTYESDIYDMSVNFVRKISVHSKKSSNNDLQEKELAYTENNK